MHGRLPSAAGGPAGRRRGPLSRRRLGRGLLLLLTLAVLAVAWPWAGVAEAKSYHISKVEIEATVRPDGTMAVLERRTFVFNGSFSEVIQDLALRPPPGSPASRVTISEIVVAEGGTPYTAGGQGPGSFSTITRSNLVEVTWRFAAQNTSRTFELSYVIDGAVVVHDDVAELYWKFIGEEWEVRQDAVRVVLNLPAGAAPGQVRAWGHGPLTGEVDITTPSQVTWTLPSLQSGQFLEGRVTCPPELVPAATLRTGRDALDEILRQEQRWADEANRERLRRQLVTIVGGAFGFIALVGGILLALRLQLRYGKEFRPEFSGDYYRELPGEYTPAETGSLWRFGPVTAQEITATIMDLARKGQIVIEVNSQERRVLGGLLGSREETQYLLRRTAADKAGLVYHETMLLDFFFGQVAMGAESLDFDDIKAFGKRSPRAMQAFVRDFEGAVRGTPTTESFFDAETERIKMWEIAGGALLFIAGVGAGALGSIPGLVGGALGGIVLMVGGAAMRRRTQLGSTHLAMWRAFRRFLLHFSALDKAEVPQLVIWEHYLVYAVVLGVAKEVIEGLKIVYPQISDSRAGASPWLWMHMASGRFAPAAMISSMTDSLQSSVSSAMSYRPSSGGGSGGGFSGGGGGFGGGGGGGRAR